MLKMKNILASFLLASVAMAAIFYQSSALASACHHAGIEISDGYLKATPPKAPVSAGYLTIQNAGSDDIYLTGAHAAFSETSAIHDMKMSNGVMIMTEVEDGIIVSAGKKVSLAPGGMHLMFMGLTQQLKIGDKHIITLTFDKCGDWDVSLPVRNGAMSGHNQNSHKHH
jgi:copper(I)-binding protein